MQTESLRWFQQVADGTTVTEVSDIEMVTQSGVSRALARLESEVGAPLLRRSGRTLRLTRAGAAFKRHVDAMLHDLDDGLAAVNQLIDPDTGTVAVAFQLSLGSWLVPDLVSSFRADHPHVSFELRPIRDELVSEVLEQGHVDLEVSALRPRDDVLRWRPFLTEPLHLALPRNHRLADRRHVQLSEVSSERFIALRTTTALRRQCDALCERAGFTAWVAFESDDLTTIRGFVAAGLGIAIVPGLRAGSPEVADGPLSYVPIADHGASREIGLIWKAERRLLPAAEVFRRHVIDRAAAGSLPLLAGTG